MLKAIPSVHKKEKAGYYTTTIRPLIQSIIIYIFFQLALLDIQNYCLSNTGRDATSHDIHQEHLFHCAPHTIPVVGNF